MFKFCWISVLVLLPFLLSMAPNRNLRIQNLHTLSSPSPHTFHCPQSGCSRLFPSNVALTHHVRRKHVIIPTDACDPVTPKPAMARFVAQENMTPLNTPFRPPSLDGDTSGLEYMSNLDSSPSVRSPFSIGHFDGQMWSSSPSPAPPTNFNSPQTPHHSDFHPDGINDNNFDELGSNSTQNAGGSPRLQYEYHPIINGKCTSVIQSTLILINKPR
jgi:hypothetical protein